MATDPIIEPEGFTTSVLEAALKQTERGLLPLGSWDIDGPQDHCHANGPSAFFTIYSTDVGPMRLVLRHSTSTDGHWGYKADIYSGDYWLGGSKTDKSTELAGRLVVAVQRLIAPEVERRRAQGLGSL